MALAKPIWSFANDPDTGMFRVDPDEELRNEYPDLMEAWIKYIKIREIYISLSGLETKNTNIILSDKIKEAKDNFKEKQFKDAYGKVNQAIRLFLSYELNLNKEITNEEILLYLIDTKIPVDEIKTCFKLSSLVEFAKHEENENDFNIMVDMAKDIIHKKFNNPKNKSSEI